MEWDNKEGRQNVGFLMLHPVHNTLFGAAVCVCLKCSSYPMGFSRVFSLCQELHPDEIDTDSAYILFYEQQGVDYAQFLPKIDGKKMADTSSMDEDFESDYKKYCVLQWAQLHRLREKPWHLPLGRLWLRQGAACGCHCPLWAESTKRAPG